MVKKIAIQFYGLIRGFRFKKTRDMIYKNIIQELQNQGFEIHIFIYTYDIEYDDIIYNLDKEKFNIKGIIVDSDKKIQNYLENEYKLEEKYNFASYWTKQHKYGWFKGPCYSEKKVNEMRNKYQKENNIEYEWIIMTSPQQEPQKPIDDLRKYDNQYMYSPNYAFFGGYYDSFFIGNAEHMDYVSELWDYMIEKKFKNDKNKDYKYFKKCLINAEPIFKKYIDSKYIMKPIMNMRFHRIRYHGEIVDH